MTYAYDLNQDFQRFKSAERDAKKALRAQSVEPKLRRVTVEGKTYVAVSAHELLEHLSETEHHAYRPGRYL